MKTLTPAGMFGFASCLWILTIAPSLAAPLPQAHVSADAKWMLHLDINQFAPSETCRILMNHTGGTHTVTTLMNHYHSLLGADPLKTLSTITLYGEQASGNRGVAIVRGTIPSKKLISRLSSYPGYTTRKRSGTTIHLWKDKTSEANMNACLYSSGLLVITSDDASMNSALGILEGSQPSLAGKRNPSLTIPSAVNGAFLTVASCGYAGASPHPLKAMLLRNTSCTTMQVAESKGMLDATIALAAVSTDAAFQIHQILNGLIVSAAFTEESSGLARLAEWSEVNRQDRLVSVRIHCAARDAAGALASALLSK